MRGCYKAEGGFSPKWRLEKHMAKKESNSREEYHFAAAAPLVSLFFWLPLGFGKE